MEKKNLPEFPEFFAVKKGLSVLSGSLLNDVNVLLPLNCMPYGFLQISFIPPPPFFFLSLCGRQTETTVLTHNVQQ